MSNIIVKSIPNTITCLNIASGCVAIALAFAGHIEWASVAILAAAIFDFCDGAAARALKAYSPIGAELDSLCDVVSFGVAPAAMVYTLLPAPACYFALAIPVCGALRLARFNVETSKIEGFIGMPIPANALFWIGMAALWQAHDPSQSADWTYGLMILLVALTMVAPVHLPSLKFHDFKFGRENNPRYLLILLTVSLVCWLGLPGFAVAIAIYFLYGAIATLANRR